MASPSRGYHIVPRDSGDSDRQSSPNEALLPNINPNALPSKLPKSYSITFMPVLLLRVLSTIFATTSFALFVVFGNESTIASTVFLGLIMFFNIVMIIHHCVSHVLKITVELRQSGWKQSLGTKSKPKAATLFDIGLSLCLFICLVAGHVLHRPRWDRWRDPSNVWEVGFAFGYVCLFFQILLAIPALDKKSITISAKLNGLEEKWLPDLKIPRQVTIGAGALGNGSPRGRAKANPSRESAESLV